MAEEMAPAPEEGGADPIAALGEGMAAFVGGVMKSQLGDDVKQQAQATLDSFQQLIEMIGGGGAPGGEQPVANQSQMAGANPNAVPVR